MNPFENWFLLIDALRNITERQILPWLLAGYKTRGQRAGLGAGPGATTEELRRRASRVTKPRYDHKFARGSAGDSRKQMSEYCAAMPRVAVSRRRILCRDCRARPASFEIPRAAGKKRSWKFIACCGRVGISCSGNRRRLAAAIRPHQEHVRADRSRGGVRAVDLAWVSKISIDMKSAAFRICALRAREALTPSEILFFAPLLRTPSINAWAKFRKNSLPPGRPEVHLHFCLETGGATHWRFLTKLARDYGDVAVWRSSFPHTVHQSPR